MVFFAGTLPVRAEDTDAFGAEEEITGNPADAEEAGRANTDTSVIIEEEEAGYEDQPEYYDRKGYYHDFRGYIYTPYGFYDAERKFHQYPAGEYPAPVYTADGLRAIDPLGERLYVPIYYPVYVNEDRVQESKALIKMKWIGQNPELPSGCEITSLTTVLNFLGFPVDKITMAKGFLPRIEGNVNFRESFLGDPFSPFGFGCYANVIVKAANNYLATQETNLHAFDYTQYSFEGLLNQVAAGNPVIIWVSNGMDEPFYGPRFEYEGETLRWISREHCVVLIGYNLEQDAVIVSDPFVGPAVYDIELFKKRFIQFGFQAVIIKSAEERLKEEGPLAHWPFKDRFLPADQYVRGCKGFDGVSEAD